MSAPATTGAWIAAAIDRAKLHEATSPRPLRVRLLMRHGDDRGDGLLIWAVIAARTPSELAAQDRGIGQRTMSWLELDARAAELPDLVDACVAEATKAISLEATA